MRIVHIFIFLVSLPAAAEYRAYMLEITPAEGQEPVQVVSVLDDIQYPEYYPLRTGETIQLVQSWMCWERSDHFKAICKRPQPAESTTPTDDKARIPAQDQQKNENPPIQ